MLEQFVELELSVGDVLQIDNHIVTILDIDGPEVSLRIDDIELNLVSNISSPAHDLAFTPK